jgi:hypothetical protein
MTREEYRTWISTALSQKRAEYDAQCELEEMCRTAGRFLTAKLNLGNLPGWDEELNVARQ